MNRTQFSSLIASATIVTSVLPVSAETYESWINPSVLAKDHRAYCSDIVAQNTFTDIGSTTQQKIYSSSNESHASYKQANSRQRKKSGRGGIKFFGIGANGGGDSITNRSNQLTYSSNKKATVSRDTSYSTTHDRTKIISETVGKNCDAFVQSAAVVETTKINADVNRELIKSKEKVKLQEIETNAQINFFNTLMQGW